MWPKAAMSESFCALSRLDSWTFRTSIWLLPRPAAPDLQRSWKTLHTHRDSSAIILDQQALTRGALRTTLDFCTEMEATLETVEMGNGCENASQAIHVLSSSNILTMKTPTRANGLEPVDQESLLVCCKQAS